MHGVLVLDKPQGPTSSECVQDIKHRLGQKKIGHAGTLDPMATGVLVVLLGEGTKLAPFLTEGIKIYSGSLRLGVTTDTFDAEGRVTAEAPWDRVTPEQAAQAVDAWKAMTTQEIPPYSAVKVGGKPLYALARKGRDVPVVVKPIQVFDAEVLRMDLPDIDFRVTVGSGAYVRSLVHSLGTRLGCGAHLTKLTREYSHPFGLAQACDHARLLAEPERLAPQVTPLGDALPHWPRLTLSERQAALVRNGGWIAWEEFSCEGSRAMFLDPEGRPVALAEVRTRDGGQWWAILRGLFPQEPGGNPA
ncbi:tRNA pseudouridine(55) synthase TruB [Fundidesulfovibrio butyratiphilus]